jgi:hypothetical protein
LVAGGAARHLVDQLVHRLLRQILSTADRVLGAEALVTRSNGEKGCVH